MCTSRQLGKWAFLLLGALICGCSQAQVQLQGLAPSDTLVAFTGAKAHVGFGQPPYGDAWVYNHRLRSFHRLTDTRVNITDVELFQEQPGGEVGALVAAALTEDERTFELGAPAKLQRLPLREPISLIDREDFANTSVYSLSVCDDGSAGAYVDHRKHSYHAIYAFKTEPFEKKEIGSVDMLGDLTMVDCGTVAVHMGGRDSLNSFVLFRDGARTGRFVVDEDLILAMGASGGLLYVLAGNRIEGRFAVFTFDPMTAATPKLCTFEGINLTNQIAPFGDVVFLASTVDTGSNNIVSLRLADCSTDEIPFEGMLIRNISALHP